MTRINKIQRACEDVVAGRAFIEGRQGWCMAGTRMVVERANGWPSHRFYELINWMPYRTAANIRKAPGTPWARSVEEAFIRQGWTVEKSQARAGDLAFARVPEDEGHVGNLYTGHDGRLWVLENASVRRGVRLRGPQPDKVPYWVNTMPLEQWDHVTSIGRLPDEWVFAEVPDAAPAFHPAPAPVPQVVVPPPLPAAPAFDLADVEIIVGDGVGGFFNRTGQRWSLDLGDGREVIVNSEALRQPGANGPRVYVDIRRKA